MKKTKYIVLIGDGMADLPLKELGGRTPLQAAFTPNMDWIASHGIRGMVNTIPKGYSPGSDVANMSILGYDPAKYYSGRAPLEAASMGVELEPDDVAYRCNLVTLKFYTEFAAATMEDYSAGHITTHEAARIIEAINITIKEKDVFFYPGVSYRHLMVWKNGRLDAVCTPPHDILTREISKFLPQGGASEFLNNIMRNTLGVLQKHDINRSRIRRGLNPANSIWLWGQGKKPALQSFKEKYGLDGAMVSAVDLTRGLAVCAGMDVLKVPGVTGYLDTNYTGKAQYSLDYLASGKDFVYLHVEAPDEAGHMGNLKDKLQAIEDFDDLVVGGILQNMRQFDRMRILLMPDHPTPIEARTHTADPVPFVIFDTAEQRHDDVSYDERIANSQDCFYVSKGHKLMDYFIKGV